MSLASVFRPRSVAVVGASPTSQYGRQALENFTRLGFAGQVAAVNPKYADILGYRCYPSLREMPFVPEAVVVGVGRERVLPVVQEAAAVGARAAVVFAIGLGEGGPDGRRLQERIAGIAREAGMTLIGPNCQGAISFVEPCALYMGRVNPYAAGCVGLFSQSGSILTALLNNRHGVRWSHAVSCGNEAVTGSADVVAYYAEDPHTRVICGFMETVRQPERFFAACDRARASGKPVVILKSGRTEAARRAARAHSGALAAPDRLYDALFARHAVLRVESQDELLATAVAMQSPRPVAGGRVAAVTGSGGQIELILDETGRSGLTHPELAPETQARLREVLPDFLATANPLDYWGVADPAAAYPVIMDALAADPNVDIVVGVADPSHGPTNAPGAHDRIYRGALHAAGRSGKAIALVTPLGGEPPPEDVERLLGQGVLVLSGFPEGFRALGHLAAWSRPPAAPVPPPGVGDLPVGGEPLTGQAALNFLARAGIPTVRSVEVLGADAAVGAAEAIGYPVVVKASTAHKTDAGAVALGVRDADAVRGAVARLPGGPLLVQGQVTGGVEMIVGVQSDAQLGAFVLVGLGGIWTEVLDDVAIRPAGLLAGEAAAMVAGLRGARLLQGARGRPPADMASLLDAIARIDALAARGEIESLDVNPLIVLPDGVLAVDCLVVPRGLAPAAGEAGPRG